MSIGYVHIYTGNGKGKTTAAAGLCARAAGRGLRCAFIQFMKKTETGEMFSFEKMDPPVIFEQYGSGDFIVTVNEQSVLKEKRFAEEGFDRAKKILIEGLYDIVVLDEIVTLTMFKLVDEESILDLIDLNNGRAELILTGRCAGEALIRRADLVTEMKEVKHYYNSGIPARSGIEY